MKENTSKELKGYYVNIFLITEFFKITTNISYINLLKELNKLAYSEETFEEIKKIISLHNNFEYDFWRLSPIDYFNCEAHSLEHRQH